MGNCVGNSKQMQSDVTNENKVTQFLSKPGYKLENILGEGDYSLVYKASKDNTSVAIKIYKQYKDDYEKENEILKKLKGQDYVIQKVDQIVDKKIKMKAIVTELYDCSLEDIKKLNKFNFIQVIALTYQLLKALQVLNQQNVIHSDIKPANILYSSDKKMFVLSDFGLSHQLKNPKLQNTNYTLMGNIYYQSPEVYNGQKPYTLKVDVFSIGVLVLEILTQNNFDVLKVQKLHTQSLMEAFPELKYHENKNFIQNILSNMVNHVAEKRLDPDQLLYNIEQFQYDENCLKYLKLKPQDCNKEENKKFDTKFFDSKTTPGLIKKVEYTKPNDQQQLQFNQLLISLQKQDK
ncbi:kinase domain protein (macronuclear) [Tetrahymena thermophila SB210]|uniref:Kinase domain protein n=1 Tax=Tetrahymena thermophila (strain SB210) TaxID=312017 RepID=I7M3W0_TETTS|nr:kinase domain protein [Tetrahymena thermophila SB210]EAS04397.2 kinase domain protein [Tetrahymena thermophila SB210]|eukprot:XP_001024642.2 kinase domain protein [Tetrahymena thermophila SB210]